MLLEFLAVAVLLCALLYRSMTKNFGFFASKGVYEEPGSFPFGSETHKKVVGQKVPFITATTALYQK